MQSRALLYLFTLTHAVMEAMAAAEQAIELATATTSPATSAVTNPVTTATTTTAAKSPATAAGGSVQSLTSSHQQITATQAADVKTTADAKPAQHGHMDPLQEALHMHLQRQSQVSVEEEGGEHEAQPLIAAPQGLLQVSLDQRPAKKYFDRSVLLVPTLSRQVIDLITHTKTSLFLSVPLEPQISTALCSAIARCYESGKCKLANVILSPQTA